MDARSTQVMGDAVARLAKARRDAQNALRHWLSVTAKDADTAAIDEAQRLLLEAQVRVDHEVARVVIAWGSLAGEGSFRAA